ncbi:hypothetical protein AW168_03485 [Nocardia brasiliensis]|uniref:Uncharacterized protein n=1 Tax=Nocardia brasiliensis (strain ATCC 700358 / HUJEG-1) TaxID=1133849 RepID=K0EV04_NOCB7|nr:hypothetical protein O3I_014890 [Nocardia brasiliensis ATCC 700358]OCF84166.1 hypothetical protein AW168_03485 [Nocardia brasiliensis]
MEKTVPATFQSPVTVATVNAAHDYCDRGWTVTETANGVCLITDEQVAAVELTGALAGEVSRFLHANNLLGPVVELPGAQRREFHLVVGAAKAALAIAALRDAGAIVHTDGASIPLPPTRLANGAACWKIAPDEARWVPPVVAIAAAARASAAHRARQLTTVAC